MSCFTNLLRYHQLLNTHAPALHALLHLDQLLARREKVREQNRRRIGVWTLGEQYVHGHTRIATGPSASGAPCARLSAPEKLASSMVEEEVFRTMAGIAVAAAAGKSMTPLIFITCTSLHLYHQRQRHRRR
jgi:hypothetical protein